MANNLKRNIFHYGDKIIFAVCLIIFVVVAMMTYVRQRPPEDELIPSPGKAKDEYRALFVKLEDIIKDFDTPDIPADYITRGFATDPDKIEPIAGEEKQCPRCGYIVPLMTKKCPNCRYLFEDDDDDDGMDNTWEDKYLCVDRYTPDAHKDPDKDGFTNIEEYAGGSDPCDPKSIPSPFRVVKKEQRPVDILFKGYVVREGGNPDVPDPLYWDLQINWGRNTKTKILNLGEHFHGYHLYPLEKRKEIIKVDGGPDYEKYVYYLTIQKRDKDPIILKEGQEAREHEYYIALQAIRGPDAGKPFDPLYEADEITIILKSGSPVVKETFRIITIDDEKVILRDSKGKIYTLY